MAFLIEQIPGMLIGASVIAFLVFTFVVFRE